MARTIKQVLNDANPNTLADAGRVLKLGTHLNGATAQVRCVVTSDTAVLPDGLRAAVILTARATVGTTVGLKTVVAGAPAATQVGISATGLPIFNAADAVTEVELVFIPVTGDIIEETIPLNAAGLGTIGGSRKAKLLLDAEVTTGAAAGVKVVLARASAPAAGQAAINAAGSGIQFNVAAASSNATVRYISSAAPGASSAELLNTDQTNI